MQGSVGATIRIYLEKYEADHSKLELPTGHALSELAQIALRISDIVKFTGRAEPTVIT